MKNSNIKTTSSDITLADHWDHLLARSGVRRNEHLIEPGLYASGKTTKDFSTKGFMIGGLMALNFTGSTTFTSVTGVKREIFTYVPKMAWMFGIGIILVIVLSSMRLLGGM